MVRWRVHGRECVRVVDSSAELDKCRGCVLTVDRLLCFTSQSAMFNGKKQREINLLICSVDLSFLLRWNVIFVVAAIDGSFRSVVCRNSVWRSERECAMLVVNFVSWTEEDDCCSRRRWRASVFRIMLAVWSAWDWLGINSLYNSDHLGRTECMCLSARLFIKHGR